MYLSQFKLLTKADAAAIFGVCTKTIDNYIHEGRLPPPVPFASREYWHPADFHAFLDNTFRRSKPGSPADGSNQAEVIPQASTAHADANMAVLTDSSPVIRQQRRQQAKLRQLNAGA